MTTQTPDAVREAANVAAFHAIYGKDTDPFTRPEAFGYASEVAGAVIAALDSRAGDAEPKNPMRKVQSTGKFKGRAGRYCSLNATLECGHMITATGEVACSDLRYAKRRACSECGDIARHEWMNNRYKATPAPAVDAVPAGEVERLRAALARIAAYPSSSRIASDMHADRETLINIARASLSHGEGRK